MTRRYADGTRVPIQGSINELEKLIERFGADEFILGRQGERRIVAFRKDGIPYRLTIPETDDEREARRLWRCVVHCTKAKLVAVEEGLEQFETAFASDIVLRDGRSLRDAVRGAIERGDVSTAGIFSRLLPAPAEDG